MSFYKSLEGISGALTGLGDPGPSTYKRSRRGDAEIDRALAHVLAAAGDGSSIVDSTVPTNSVTDGLTKYPIDLLSSPVDVRNATVTIAPGTAAPIETSSTKQSVSRMYRRHDTIGNRPGPKVRTMWMFSNPGLTGVSSPLACSGHAVASQPSRL